MGHKTSRCPDCGAKKGDFHHIGCDVEQCPYCGRQLISCECGRLPPLDDRMRWTGVWPGVLECQELGWYARLIPGQGWVSCDKGEPGATEDLNRLLVTATWDRDQKRWVVLSSEGMRDD